MLVSVIVPVYKAERWLHRCVDSILAQTMTDFELLLIDDGSPDKSGEICDEYAAKDNRVRIFHKENGGVSSARNLGIDNAQGEYVMFVDADDWVGENYIKDIYDHRDGDALIIQGHCRYKGDKVFYLEEYENKYYDEKEIVFTDICEYGFPFAKLYSLDVLSKHNIRFVLGLNMCEDNIFMYEYILAVRKVKFISGINYFYDYIENSLSNKKVYDPYECYVYYEKLRDILLKYKELLSKEQHYDIDKFIANSYIRCFYMLYLCGYNFEDRKKFFKKNRTEDGIRLLLRSYNDVELKSKVLINAFCKSWILFDIIKWLLTKLKK